MLFNFNMNQNYCTKKTNSIIITDIFTMLSIFKSRLCSWIGKYEKTKQKNIKMFTKVSESVTSRILAINVIWTKLPN